MNGWNHFKLISYGVTTTIILTACGGGSSSGDDDPDPSNRAPTAEDISIQSNLNNPYINIKLIGTDPDNDTLSYVLEASNEGDGYEQASL